MDHSQTQVVFSDKINKIPSLSLESKHLLEEICLVNLIVKLHHQEEEICLVNKMEMLHLNNRKEVSSANQEA